MIKVSVIIPTYNRSELLPSAIQSVLNQTFQDFEIIVVDDCSKDNNCEVVSNFNDRRIKYIRHEANKGGSAARNTGIVNSSYEYIAFLDDDDEWLPNKLMMQVDLLENSPPKVGGVYTGYITVDRTSGEVLLQKTPIRRGDLSNKLFLNNCIGSTSSILLRKECFEKVGLFDESLPSFQDYDMWIRISREFHFDYVKEPLFKYYIHKNKIWTNLEALDMGMELMLKKYGKSPAFRKNYSRYYLFLGVRYCYNGNVKKGREAFLKAIGLYPFEVRHYFNLFLSLLGAENFRRIKDIKERLVVFLKRSEVSID